jgi:hypothetical protein
VLKEQRPENNKRRKIGTLHCLKTAVTARLHSKPRNEGQAYLELWSLKLNRARWARAEQQAQERIKGIDRAISKLKLSENDASSPQPGEPRANKTIDFKHCAVPQGAP